MSDQNPEIDVYGNKFWYNSLGQHHREDGPAIEYTNGDKFWYKNGLFHREDGPAFDVVSERKEWWIDNHHFFESITFSKWE